MRVVVLLLCFFFSLTFAEDLQQKTRTEKNIEKALEDEKKFAREQKFYKYDNYDFKGAQVDEKSLDSVPILEPQYDFDMTHVYD